MFNMIRRILTLLSLIGLLLSVGLWSANCCGVAYWRVSHAGLAPHPSRDHRVLCETLTISVYDRHLMVDFLDETCSEPWVASEWYVQEPLPQGSGTAPPWFERGATGTTRHIPLYLPVVLLAPYPMIRLLPVAYRRRKRRNLGLCLNCEDDVAGASLLS
jgi:hypothetical protein